MDKKDRSQIINKLKVLLGCDILVSTESTNKVLILTTLKQSYRDEHYVYSDTKNVVLSIGCYPLISEGLLRVYNYENGRFGFVNEDLEIVIPYNYHAVYSFIDGYAEVKKDGRYGIIDTRNRIIVPIIYRNIIRFQDWFKVLGDDNRSYGAYNNKLKLIIPVIHDNVFEQYGVLIVGKDGKYGAYLKDGKQIAKTEHNAIRVNKDSLVSWDGKNINVIKL